MLKDLLKACRSYRGYDESYRFTEEELMELVDHTRYAASSHSNSILHGRKKK
ncbi:MAG: hypothetical protein ACLTD0_02605 [Coprococcus comes]